MEKHTSCFSVSTEEASSFVRSVVLLATLAVSSGGDFGCLGATHKNGDKKRIKKTYKSIEELEAEGIKMLSLGGARFERLEALCWSGCCERGVETLISMPCPPLRGVKGGGGGAS